MTIMIIIKIKSSAKRRNQLRNKPTPSEISDAKISDVRKQSNVSCLSNISDARQLVDAKKASDAKDKDDQTTNALLAIVILFLICEVPIACILLASLFDFDIFLNIVLRTYYLAHLLRLLNASLNFILYCAMSSLFRATFVEMFSSYVPTFIRQLFGLHSDNIETPTASKATDSMELSGQSHAKIIIKPDASV